MVRLDIWLDVACVFKTRSEAQRACNGGKVVVNGDRGKPHRNMRVGDTIDITMGAGRHRRLVVIKLADRPLVKAEARTLYNDITPLPTPEEVEFRDMLRRAGPVPGARKRGEASPDRRDRRVLRRLKGGD